MNLLIKGYIVFVAVCAIFVVSALPVSAAQLILSPASGTFTVGSTFDVSIFLDSEDQSVNVVNAEILFPPDKLQLVSPTTGQSIISVWTAQPVFNNKDGLIQLTGGIPGGIKVSRGLITTLTFRVKQTGNPVLVRFSDKSTVLANDGKGTAVLSGFQNGIVNLILPPPAGPVVSSETHPDQSEWYSNKNVILRWASVNAVEKYSYVIDKNPVGIPDNIADGDNGSVVYKDLENGIHYFHIKSLRDGAWGGVTHFGINIDAEAPAEFPVEVIPSSRTSSKNQIINFLTTDSLSGIAYYEVKTIPLSQGSSGEQLFVETMSPHQSALDLGSYDVIIRAYDNAGNYRDVQQRIKIVAPFLEFVTDQGVRIIGGAIIPWMWVWILILIFILITAFLAWSTRRWHHDIHSNRQKRILPDALKSQLSELQKYKQKYGSLAILLAVGVLSLFGGNVADAQQKIELAPPSVSTVSRDISNEEIFYIGGNTLSPLTEVVIYLQNMQTGEAVSETVTSDKTGEWFYRHPRFLSPGNYVLWTQGRSGEIMSPPGPQIELKVVQTAIQFGGSRLSYETLYLGLTLILLFIVILLGTFIIYHAYHGRKKHKLFWKEVREAEEAVRRGFAVLKRDIEAELSIVRKAKLSPSVREEIKQREMQLLGDLETVRGHIGKEVWDIGQIEQSSM
ncbi:MAG: cohesin domain-containing protein [Patescibacteria group bacterium]